MQMTLSPAAANVLRQLSHAGYEAFVVGGCVRDSLLGRSPDDWDLTTSALPQQVIDAFPGHQIIETGLRHGTVTVLMEHQPVEITTYRIDGGYSDGRHPDQVAFTRSLREDLARRDFTVNALAWSPETGLVDYFGGVEDLDHGLLRCVGNPGRRFHEDALRILRALRLSAILGFSIEPESAQSLRECRGLLSQIAVERIQAELTRLLCGGNASAVVRDFHEVFLEVLPGLDGDPALLNRLPPVPSVRLAALFTHYAALRQALDRLRFDRATAQAACTLSTSRAEPVRPDRASLLHRLNRIGDPLLRLLLALQEAEGTPTGEASALLDRLIGEGACWSLDRLAVNGRDLLALGVPRGPELGALLHTLLNAVIDGNLPNEREALLRRVHELRA